MKKNVLIVICTFLCCFGFLLLANASSTPILLTNAMRNFSYVGRYEFSTAGGSNVWHCDENIVNCNVRTGTPVRLPGDNGGRYMGTAPDGTYYGEGGNSSSSILSKPSNNAKIIKAFLIEEAFIYSPDTFKTLSDHPMKLIGPKGGTTYSNPMDNLIYTANPYQSHNNHVTTTVTDVTSFVQSQGFGSYQGWDIPYWNRGASGYQTYDMTASWKLIVICEDEALPLKMTRLKIGAMDYSDGRIAQVRVDGAGIRTKTSGDVTGQLLIGGAGGDANGKGSMFEFTPSPNTPLYHLSTGRSGEINRESNFLEGLSSINGNPRSDLRSLGNRINDGQPFHNNDLILLDVNNTRSNAQNGHNAYFVNDSTGITVRAQNSQTVNTITALGIIADIDTASYASSISHNGQAWQDTPLQMSAHLENNTNSSKMNLGVSGGYALVNVDSNITLDPQSIKASFYDRSSNQAYTLPSSMVSLSGNTIKVIFGSNNNGQSQVGDKLDITWSGKPNIVGNYQNTVSMHANGIITEDNVTTNMDTTRMTSASDSFSAKYNNPPVIHANDQFFYEGQYSNQYWKDVQRWKDVSASDVEDGNLSDKVSIKSDNVDVNTPGSYNVIYTVTDSLGKTTEKTVTITVLYNNPPTIEAQDRWFYASEDVNTERLMERVKAEDIEDGNITHKALIFESNVQNHVIGDYKVTYKVTDAFGKSAQITVNIHIVKDIPTGDEVSTYPRFISKKYIDTLKPTSFWRTPVYAELLNNTLNKTEDAQAIEHWQLTPEDIDNIKNFNATHDWSQESNQAFLDQFGSLLK